MKHKLIVKVFSGPQIGRLLQTNAALTANVSEAVNQVTEALRAAGVTVDKSKLRLRLRRLAVDGYFIDGVFITSPTTFGVFIYGPRGRSDAWVDNFLCQNVDAIPFFFAHQSCAPEPLLVEPVLPTYPELPEPIEVLWSASLAPINN